MKLKKKIFIQISSQRFLIFFINIILIKYLQIKIILCLNFKVYIFIISEMILKS